MRGCVDGFTRAVVVLGLLGLAAPGTASALGGPVDVLPPSISGSAVQGSVVTCSPGTWAPTPTAYTYSWQRDITTTIGGSSDQYTLTAADVGQAITCTVVAADSLGSSLPAVSVPVVPVALPVAAVPIATSLPAITGSAVQGQTVGCSPGAWENSPTSYAFSWQRDGTAITGQVADQYTLAAADVGQAITCTVVASNASGTGPPAVSLPVIPSAALNTGVSGGSGGGGSSSAGSSGSGTAGGATPKPRPPSVISFGMTPRRMVVTVRGRRQQTKGVVFSYRLNEAANVQIVIERSWSGRMAGSRCVANPPRHARKGKRCTGYTTVTTIRVRNARAALDRLRYSGRAGRSLLPAAGYRAVISASNGAGRSNTRWAGFSVVRKVVVVRSRRS